MDIKNFVERWRNHGDENSDTATFWLEFLKTVCGVEEPGEVIKFQKRTEFGNTGFIDCYIPLTKVLIEQKGLKIDLNKKYPQSDGSLLTPFEQAVRYYGKLFYDEIPRWIIVCNFKEFHIHDMKKADPPEIILLENLEDEIEKFSFMVNINAKAPKEIREEKISQKAGKLVEKLKDSLNSRYKNPENDEDVNKKNERDLTVFCVRTVFLLYAEDSGLFERHQFHDYLVKYKNAPRTALIGLFDVLAREEKDRSPYISDDLKNFPYVDGGLFGKKDKNCVVTQDIEIPQLDGEPIELIINEMSEGFNWSDIKPPIFGAIFERVLGGERDAGGMHYTTLDNIHKVIDPLFLDDLNAELDNIFAISNKREKTQSLIEFQNKLASLRFLDPACGSGNFLTESFISLRKMENKILNELHNLNPLIDFEIKVSIFQFYGIEANDFAVAVARTALWISEHQMLKEAEDFTKKAPLPLKEYDNIKEGSAMDKLEGLGWKLPGWNIPHENMLYIMGNPPFIGYSQQNEGQKSDVRNLIGSGKVDYVACWFAVASEYLQDKNTKAAFVATNSITQGEQVSAIFRNLHKRFGIEIDFAYQSFAWDSELKDMKAHVHCVIIGFSTNPPKLRKLYSTPDDFKLVENINFYLKPAPNFFVEARKDPICDVPPMILGNIPRDGGNLILTLEERDEIIKANPTAEKFIRPFIGAEDFIRRKPRYCFWLVDVNIEDIKKYPKVWDRVKRVKKFRLASTREATKRLAAFPSLFSEIRQPTQNYIVVPRHSSENRDYIPFGFMSHDVIAGDAVSIIPNANLYHFGVLTSRVHMAWTRATAGRIKSDYRYSNTIVYNNFVWPSPNKKQRAKIEATAQKILDVRAKYPENSFAGLYDSLIMPPDLLKAHRENDSAVCQAYGFDRNISEEEIVEKLFEMLSMK